MSATIEQYSQGQVSKLIRNLDTVVTLPEITTRIAAVVNDHRSTARDLHHIISHDPALVTRLLKLVNSSFYGRSVEIDSVQRAIVLLGFDAVYHLAIAATIGPLFKGGKISGQWSAKDLWTHCVAVAAVARHMALWIGYPPADEAFLAGLLHDVGLLASLQANRGGLRRVCEVAGVESSTFVNLERLVIGADHEELGAALAQQWKFPQTVREVAGHHHDPFSAPEQYQMFSALIHVADILCCQNRIGFPLAAEKQALDETALRDLVSPSVINIAREKLQGWVAPAIQIFA